MGQRVPGTAGAQQGVDGIEDFAHVGCFGSSAGGKDDVRDEEFPLGIVQIGVVGFAERRHIIVGQRASGECTVFGKIRQEQFTNLPKLRRSLLRLDFRFRGNDSF